MPLWSADGAFAFFSCLLGSGFALFAVELSYHAAANKANPDPTKDVYWGDQTWEEMQFTAITFSLNGVPAKTNSGGQK